MNDVELESQVRDMLDSHADALAWEQPPYPQLRRSGLRRRRLRDGALGASAIALIAGAFFAVHVTGGPGDVTAAVQPAATLPVDSDGWDPSQPAMAALRAGELTVSVRDGVACYQLDGEPVAWPTGFRAQPGTLALLNDKGQVVAMPGQRVAFGGGGGYASKATPCHTAGEAIVDVEDLHTEPLR
jgi:hypothetical protein